MIDVSDGLLQDLGHVAVASSVVIDLDSSAFEIADPVQTVASATGRDALAMVLTGGEDHALAACFAADRVPQGWTVVGRVQPTSEDHHATVLVDGIEWDGPRGWDHFQH